MIKDYLVTGTRRQVFSRVIQAESGDDAKELFEAQGDYVPDEWELEEEETFAEQALVLEGDEVVDWD